MPTLPQETVQAILNAETGVANIANTNDPVEQINNIAQLTTARVGRTRLQSAAC